MEKKIGSAEKESIQIELTAEERADLINAVGLLECQPDLRNLARNPFPSQFHNERTGTITEPPSISEVLAILKKFKDKLISSSGAQ